MDAIKSNPPIPKKYWNPNENHILQLRPTKFTKRSTTPSVNPNCPSPGIARSGSVVSTQAAAACRESHGAAQYPGFFFYIMATSDAFIIGGSKMLLYVQMLLVLRTLVIILIDTSVSSTIIGAWKFSEFALESVNVWFMSYLLY
jgi:hypothetical protein